MARMAGRPARKRLVAGGLVVTVHDAQGTAAGAACIADGLATRLGEAFVVRRFSVGQAPARDLYARAHRHAAEGGIAVCDAPWRDGSGPGGPDLSIRLSSGAGDQPAGVLGPGPVVAIDGRGRAQDVVGRALRLVWTRL
jgi:hypothetical protein